MNLLKDKNEIIKSMSINVILVSLLLTLNTLTFIFEIQSRFSEQVFFWKTPLGDSF